MAMIDRIFYRHLMMSILLLASFSVQADYILSAPPRESAAASEKIYTPLAAVLSRVLGEPVKFLPPKNWSEYGREIREDKYDFVIDGPHFVAWRLENTKHSALVSLPGQLAFWVAAQDGISSMDALRYARVCGLPTPNLASLVMLSNFDPFQSPELVTSRNGIKGVYTAFRERKCKAVVLRDLFVRNIPEAQAKNLNIIFRSESFPELTLTASQRVPKEKHADIVNALVNEANEATKSILLSLGGKGATSLIPAQAEKFAGFSRLLEDNAWGWNKTMPMGLIESYMLAANEIEAVADFP